MFLLAGFAGTNLRGVSDLAFDSNSLAGSETIASVRFALMPTQTELTGKSGRVSGKIFICTKIMQNRAVSLAPIPYPNRQLTLPVRPLILISCVGGHFPRVPRLPWQVGHSTRRSIGSSSGIYELHLTSTWSLRPLPAL
jgi:hypothetical protein